MKKIFLVLLTIASALVAGAQSASQKSTVYFGGGFNRSFYTKSTIGLRSNSGSFDFTLDKVRATDDKGIKFGGGGAVQYSYVLGWYSPRKKFGIEFNFDHIKYFVTPNQRVHINGQINGTQLDKDTTLIPDFVQLEHSDGANYAMLNFVKRKPLSHFAGKNHGLDLLLKAGAGVVIPKTNSTIMGVHYDDAYILSGYVIGVEGGLRYDFLKYGFISGTWKGAYANYNKFKIANGRGDQDWFSAQFNLIAGVQVPL